MQYGADWTGHYTAQAFMDAFGLDFKGPGFYWKQNDTILVLPVPPDGVVTQKTVWAVEQPLGTVYECHVFNQPFDKLVMSVIAIAPVRFDWDSPLKKDEGNAPATDSA